MAPGSVGSMGQMLQVLSGVGDGYWLLPAPKTWETTGFQWQDGDMLCLGGIALPGDIASSGSSPHQRLELQTIWHTLILPEQTAEENLQAATGDTAGAVLCPRLQSCVPLGGSWLPPLH